jgi:conjugal transfer pilus assembly protein TrbC
LLSFIGLLLILIPSLGFGSIEDLENFAPINQCTTCDPKNIKPEPTPDPKTKYLIFISCNMPDESIKLLYLESLNHNATLVMRGLIEGSFKKTAAKLQALNVIAQINPKLFKKYQIEKVPTIIEIRGSNYNTIVGNISFDYARDRLLEAR